MNLLVVFILLPVMGLACRFSAPPDASMTALFSTHPTVSTPILPAFDPALLPTKTTTMSAQDAMAGRPSSTAWPTEISAIVNPEIILLRAGPGIAYAVIQEVSKSEALTLLARDETSKWILTETRRGVRGWVSYFSLVKFNFVLSELPVDYTVISTATSTFTVTATHTSTGTKTQTPSPTHTLTPTQTGTVTPTRTRTLTPTPTSRITPSSSRTTPTQTKTSKPTRTITPSQTITPVSQLFFSVPAVGEWCEQNSVRRICVHEIAYAVQEVQDGTGVTRKHYLVFDVYIENRASFEIFVDPGKFELKLMGGNTAFYTELPKGTFGDEKMIAYTMLAPGESIGGKLFMNITRLNMPETLVYHGYIFEPRISIDFYDLQ